jgi:hypothetical protein
LPSEVQEITNQCPSPKGVVQQWAEILAMERGRVDPAGPVELGAQQLGVTQHAGQGIVQLMSQPGHHAPHRAQLLGLDALFLHGAQRFQRGLKTGVAVLEIELGVGQSCGHAVEPVGHGGELVVVGCVHPDLQVAGSDTAGRVDQGGQRGADAAIEQVGEVQRTEQEQQRKPPGAGIQVAEGRCLVFPERHQVALPHAKELVQGGLKGKPVGNHAVRKLRRLDLVATREETERLGGGDLEALLLLLDRLELQPLLGQQRAKEIEPDLLVGPVARGPKCRHGGVVLATGEVTARHQLLSHRAEHAVRDGLFLAECSRGHLQLDAHTDAEPDEGREAGNDENDRYRRRQQDAAAQRAPSHIPECHHRGGMVARV